MEIKGLMGGLYRICEWIMRLAVINLLWVICSFPIFFLALMAVVNVQVAENPQAALFQTLLLMAVISPFLLFPATAAMFAVARKWVMGEADAPLFKTFFKSYKENYLQSMLGGIVFFLFGVVMYMNYHFYETQTANLRWLAILFITLSVVLFAAMFNFFSIMVHFHMKFWQIMKNAILISIGHPATSISIIVLNLLILWVSLSKITFLIPFFMGSLMAVISYWHFNRIFTRMQAKQEEIERKENEENERNEEDADALSNGDDQDTAVYEMKETEKTKENNHS